MAFNKITNADLVGKGVVGLPDVPGLSTGAMQAKFDELALDVIVPAYNDLIDLLNGTGVADNSQITDPTDSVVKSLQALANSLKSYIDTRDATKADKATTLAGYAIGDAYTKSETDTALATKADVASSLAGYGILDAYTKTQTDNLLSAKANSATTLAGYGITDAYTKSETYSKTQADNLLATKVDKVSGKGLSTNDYDNTEKSANAANTTARHTHTNKTTLDAIDATTKGKYDALVTLLNGIVEIEAAVTNDATKIPTGAAIVDYVSGLGGGDMLKATYDANGDDVADVKVSELTDATITTPSNGQVLRYNSVTQKWENGDITEAHTIENPSGTDMTQRANLQFADAHLTDDSVNDRTEVENIKDITSADYASATEDGFYNVTDESDEELTAADIAYDSNDSIKEKIDEVIDDLRPDTSYSLSPGTDYDKVQTVYVNNVTKVGNIGFITCGIAIKSGMAANTSYSIFNIPAAIAPATDTSAVIVNENNKFTISARANGSLRVTPFSATSASTLTFTIVYPIA